MKNFKKFSIRINDFEVRNHYNDKPLFLKKGYSLFELVKWYSNPYYNKLEQYYNEGYEDSFLGSFLVKDNISINKILFNDKESCYSIGFFNINYKEPEALKIEFDCERYVNLSQTDLNIVNKLIKISSEHIIKDMNRIIK
jgi:hypothetical protein